MSANASLAILQAAGHWPIFVDQPERDGPFTVRCPTHDEVSAFEAMIDLAANGEVRYDDERELKIVACSGAEATGTSPMSTPSAHGKYNHEAAYEDALDELIVRLKL